MGISPLTSVCQSKGLDIGKDKVIHVDAMFWTSRGIRVCFIP